MKNYVALLTVAGLLFCSSYNTGAQGASGSDSKIKWGGYLQTDNRLYLKGDNDFSWHEYRLALKAEIRAAENVHFHSEVWLRSFGFPRIHHSRDLVRKDKVSPLNWDFREAYIDLYRFLSDNLDIRIGRQRVAWGTGDKLNPTDNLNPDDLEDIWDFGRHLGSDGVKASYYLKDYTINLVYIPVCTPAVLPRGDLASALAPPMELPPGATLGNATDTIIMPNTNLKNSIAGIKISKFLFGYDFSLSYVYGRDGLPLAKSVTFDTTEIPLGEVNIASELIFPRMHIVGLDMAGSIGDVGVWAEAAVFFPEKVTMTTDLTALGGGIQESIALDDKPYIKYVIGADYSFGNGIYINVQHLHGFTHERGRENLGDYFMFRLEWEHLDEKLKIIPFSGAIEIQDFEDIENNYALILSPEVIYEPVDNVEITLGLRWIDGKNTTTFGRVRDNDEMYFRVRYSF